MESTRFLVRFDHLLMCSATIPLLASFDRGGNRDLKRLSNLTKVIISSKWQSLDLKRSRLDLESVCLTTCPHSLSCPCTTWLLLKNKNKMMQNNRNQPKKKKKEAIALFQVMNRSGSSTLLFVLVNRHTYLTFLIYIDTSFKFLPLV